MLQTLSFIASHPLNRDGRLRAIGRYLRWQIGSRLMPVPHRMPFVDDTVLVMERGMTGATGNWYCGLHEHDDMAFVLHFLREDDLFLDIGANVGTYTVLASGAVGARTVAFEPIPATFAKLTRNIAANAIGHRATCHNIGAGSEDSTLHFTAGRDTMNHVVSPDELGTVETIPVPVQRIDEVLEGSPVRLAKIDVEGWEAPVLGGMPETLADPQLAAIIMETNESAGRYAGDGQDEAARIVREAGFVAHSYDPFSRTLMRRDTGTAGSHNTIFVRDMELVEQRVSTARRFRLVNGMI